jgi:hypothetical protein
MEISPLTWLCADYHLPATYSCRVPMSSVASARALPAPGPATVRLALIRIGIEVFGIKYVEEVLFPHICAMPIQIRPPERVALSSHVLRAYKVEDKTQQTSEAPVSREMAHALGSITIYIQIPVPMQDRFRQLLQMIGYWGQANSLAWCTSVGSSMPPTDECVTPLRLFMSHVPLRPFFSSILSEFRDTNVEWNDVMPLIGKSSPNPMRMDVYVWPLIEVMQHGGGMLLVRRPFTYRLDGEEENQEREDANKEKSMEGLSS